MQPLIYAHRGSSHRFAEQTRAAFLQALEDGADGVECDIHLTRNLEVVCHHDATVDRTSNGTGPLAEKTLQQLRELDFSSWRGVPIPEKFGAVSEQFLTLRELIGILRGADRPVGLAIELKHPSPYGRRLEEELLRLLRSLGWEPRSSTLGNISISFMSFDPGSVKYLAATVPPAFLCQLQLLVDRKELRAVTGMGTLAGGTLAVRLRHASREAEEVLDSGVAGIAGPGVAYVRAHLAQVRRQLDAGRRFRVWTVDDPEDVQLMLELGIQEITTNCPAEVRTLTRSRHAPH